MIREVDKPQLTDLWCKKTALPQSLNHIQFTGSGKGSIALVLGHLKEKGIINNKLDEVLVPDWLGYWVYNQIQPFAFPAKAFSNRTKVIFVYHQYGFPQDMDKILEFARAKQLIVVEDCAHALGSQYKGKPLGSFGDYTIYSFSKWFFSFALGGVSSSQSDFKAYAETAMHHTALGLTFIKDLAKILYEYSSFRKSKLLEKFTVPFIRMSYAIYGQALKPAKLAVNLALKKTQPEIDLRQKRYQYFLEQTKNLGICDHLEPHGITPYIIPIICPHSKNEAILKVLASEGIISGLYNFDTNRNMLDPNFKQCIWIPCHTGVSQDKFESVTREIIRILKK